MKIIKYNSEHKSIWNEFIESSKNGHFMFKRDYMDYHSDRFSDYSLMFFDDKERLIAVLPANTANEKLYSHQGLTFGGLVITNKTTTKQVCEIFNYLVTYLKEESSLSDIIYKRIPDFYCVFPAQEDLYAINALDAQLVRRDVGSLIDLQTKYQYSKGRKWSINKAKKLPIEVFDESEDLSDFWCLLNEVLSVQHAVEPVHTLEEISSLRTKLPKNIKCFTARLDGKLLAGALIYETETVVHTQYLANSEEGRDLGALDYLIDHLLKEVYKDKRYFDFGISTEDNGKYLNEGLISQKEGFGARAVIQDFYRIKIQ